MDVLGADPCNILIPQLLWSRRVRMSVPAVFVIALVVNVGMWLERFVIVVTSLTRDFVPSSWGMYYPTVWDWSTYAGTIGVFLALMFLFVRGLPAISIFEMREVVHHTGRSQRMPTETKVSGQLGSLYGIMAEFDDPESLLDAAGGPAPKAIGIWTPTLRCRWKAWRKRSASAAIGCSAWFSRAVLRGDRRIHVVLVDHCDRLSSQCRRTAAELLACLCPDHLRTDGADRVHHGRSWDAGAERTAAAVSPGIQRRRIRARLARQILPVHRGIGSEIRSRTPRGNFLERLNPREVMDVATLDTSCSLPGLLWL